MLNLIKLLVALALMSFSVNASAYVMTDGGTWDETPLYEAIQHVKYERKAIREYRHTQRDYIRELDSRPEKRSARMELRAEIKEMRKHVRSDKRTVRKLKNLIADCGWECVEDFRPKYPEPEGDGQDQDVPNRDVPEPGIVGLLALGLLGIALRRRLKV